VADIGLAEVIKALRSELERAMTEGESERLQFQASSLDVEFQVGITKTAEGSAGIRFWVFELGGSASHATESIQKVNLSLQPIMAEGGPVKIAKGSNENPLEGEG
jgi:Trypsin-co-occurring domain 2